MTGVDNDRLRDEITTVLRSGFVTEAFPRADTQESVMQIVGLLKATDDLRDKLRIGGFTLDPVEHEGMSQLCETCMYYKVHQKFCELPELNLPVEPEWSCRLWRI